MELIILYGAPGVGKLTVANALAGRSGYKVFHNHLTVDMVTSLFPFGSEQAGPLTARFRVEMLEAAAAANLSGVIHTFVYAAGLDDGFMQRLIDAVEPHGARVTLVLLTCEPEVLLRRVVEESRSRFGKLRDAGVVKNLLAEKRLTEPFPHRPSLIIDNTHRGADDVADQIAKSLAGAS